MYKCTFENCTKEYKKPCLLKLHTNTHYNIRPYKCTKCEKAYFKKFALDRHLVLHNGIKNYKCATCNKEYYYERDLKKHMLKCNSDSYTCFVCLKRYIRENHFLKHIRTKHGRGKNVKKTKSNSTENVKNKCLYCNKTFSKKYNLDVHVDSFHFGIKRFVCKCKSEFYHQHTFDKHKKICKTFTCDE